MKDQTLKELTQKLLEDENYLIHQIRIETPNSVVSEDPSITYQHIGEMNIIIEGHLNVSRGTK